MPVPGGLHSWPEPTVSGYAVSHSRVRVPPLHGGALSRFPWEARRQPLNVKPVPVACVILYGELTPYLARWLPVFVR